jgi:acetolactate synthase-1/2/3 large subunit
MDRTAPNPILTASDCFVNFQKQLSVSELLLEYLKLEGVSKIFGIPGGAAIFVMNELKKRQNDFQFVICRQETGACYIAHGYSAVTNGLGVVLTTSGPAAANALTGAVNAHTSCAPLLVITGEVPQKYFGQGYLQEGIDARLDIAAVYQNAVQYSAVVSSPDNFTTLFQQALREARSLPNRATHISLPNNVAAAMAPAGPSGTPVPASIETYRASPSGTDLVKVRGAFDDLRQAKRQLIFLGNGSRQALRVPRRLRAFTAFVEKFAFPVMTTPDAKGIFPESHELSLRTYGLCGCPWASIYMGQRDDEFRSLLAKLNLGFEMEPYDALLVLGSDLGELATTVVNKDAYSKLLIPRQSFIQVDLNQSVIGRNFPVTRGIVAEVGATIDELCRLGEHAAPEPGDWIERRRLFIAGIKAEFSPCDRPDWLASEAHPVNPAALMRVLNDEVKKGRIFIDCGNCVGWSLNYLVVDPPVTFHSALAMGPMGFAVGAVIGAKLALPDEPCIAVCGDGAFMMHGAEISTAAQNGAGAIWLVLNDNDLGMVSQGMETLFKSESWLGYYKLGAPDLVKFAEGLGADAVAIAPDQGAEAFRVALRDALKRSLSGKPQVIVAHIDTKPAPPYGWPQLT